jgi:hypothetical protein
MGGKLRSCRVWHGMQSISTRHQLATEVIERQRHGKVDRLARAGEQAIFYVGRPAPAAFIFRHATWLFLGSSTATAIWRNSWQSEALRSPMRPSGAGSARSAR